MENLLHNHSFVYLHRYWGRIRQHPCAASRAGLVALQQAIRVCADGAGWGDRALPVTGLRPRRIRRLTFNWNIPNRSTALYLQSLQIEVSYLVVQSIMVTIWKYWYWYSSSNTACISSMYNGSFNNLGWNARSLSRVGLHFWEKYIPSQVASPFRCK